MCVYRNLAIPFTFYTIYGMYITRLARSLKINEVTVSNLLDQNRPAKRQKKTLLRSLVASYEGLERTVA